MTRDEALSLHLGSKVYVLNKNNKAEGRYVVHLVFRGDEIRIISSTSMGNWEVTSLHMYQYVFPSREAALTVTRDTLKAEQALLTLKIDNLDSQINR